MTDETVELWRFPYRTEAQMAQALLEEAGVRCEVVADDVGGQIPGMLPARLIVLADREEEARQILVDAGLLEEGEE